MTKLEKKILKDVYSFETKQTLLKIFLRLIALLCFTFGAAMLAGIIMAELVAQKTLDIFEIFYEDVETIRENIWNVLNTFINEAPVLEIFMAIVIIILIIVLFLNLVLNFTRVKNKIIWLIKYISDH